MYVCMYIYIYIHIHIHISFDFLLYSPGRRRRGRGPRRRRLLRGTCIYHEELVYIYIYIGGGDFYAELRDYGQF